MFVFFFFEKVDGRWGARFVRHWYEKDKLLPVNPNKVPKVDQAKLDSYPEGYKCLAYCQELTMGVFMGISLFGKDEIWFRRPDTAIAQLDPSVVAKYLPAQAAAMKPPAAAKSPVAPKKTSVPATVKCFGA